MVYVTFDASYLKNVEKGVSFHDVGVSLQDTLKEPDQGIDQPKTVEHEKEDNDYEKEKIESPTAVDILPLTWRTSKDHHIENILGYITKCVTTRSKICNFCYHFVFVSQVEPKNAKDALLHEP